MGIRHIVAIQWLETITDEMVAEIQTKLNDLPNICAGITAYSCGPDLGLASGNYDFGVVADFGSEADWIEYRDHPTHQAIIADLMAPHINSRTAVQIQI